MPTRGLVLSSPSELVAVLSPADRAKSDRTALMAASVKGYAMIVELLLDAKADVNVKDKQGNTALSGEERAGHAEIVRMLRAAGAKG